MSNVLSEFKKISTFIFDIDGVLTDGSFLLLPNGLMVRRMHIKDSFAIQMALRKGYKVYIVSGSYSEEIKKRLEFIGVKEIHLGVADKTRFVTELLSSKKIKWKEVLYMGDDLPDLPLLNKVGLSCCPADAVNEVKSIVKYVSPVNAGWGCVRDVIEKVMKINGHWQYEPTVTSA